MKRIPNKLAATCFVALSLVFASAFGADPVAPDPSSWSFLEGDWTATDPDGEKDELSCRLNDSKTCYVLTSKIFQGTFGIDSSSDHPMLSLGYHPGSGYAVGHWKRESETKVTGGFWFVDNDGKKEELQSDFEMTADGFTYTIGGDPKQVYRWRKKL